MSFSFHIFVLFSCFVPVLQVFNTSADFTQSRRNQQSTVTNSQEANLRINTRDGNTPHFASEFSKRQIRFAVIEGFGPAPGLTSWLRSQDNLQDLTFICVCLSDVDVRVLSTLPHLERLDLRGCLVSEAQLDQLCANKTLKELDLPARVIPQESLQKFQKRFPDLVIRVGQK